MEYNLQNIIIKKKIFIITIACLFVCTLFSCTKNDDEPENPIIGTTWTTTYGEDKLFVINFTSENNCESYIADRNLNYIQSARQGTYSLSGNNISFSGIVLQYTYIKFYLKTGTISGSFLNTQGYKTYTSSGTESEHFDWNETWTKR